MLSEAYRISAESRLGDIVVNSVPFAGKDGKKIIDSYNNQANGGILDLIDDQNVSSTEDLKKALSQ